MADNYLERKYQEYQSQKSSATKSGYGKKKTTPIHKMRRVFVTGGADGIGKTIVKAFRMAGHRVVFCDWNEESGKETAEKTGTTFYHVDINNKEALENCMHHILEDWGDLDIIINNAGISKIASLTETSVEDFDQTLSANLRPAFITSRLLAIHRQSQTTPNSYGRIINISSTHYPTNRLSCEAYAASRSGICSLTQTLAMSLSPCHTTVNSIIPGWIQADDYDQIDPEAHPIPFSGRMGKPEDITRICLFLCQEENDFINGENITIDGGTTRTPMTIVEQQQL